MYYPSQNDIDLSKAISAAAQSRVAMSIYTVVLAALGSWSFRKAAIRLVSAVLNRYTRELSVEGPDSRRATKDILVEAKNTTNANSYTLGDLHSRFVSMQAAQRRLEEAQREMVKTQLQVSETVETHRRSAETVLLGMREDMGSIRAVCDDTQSRLLELSQTLLRDALNRRGGKVNLE